MTGECERETRGRVVARERLEPETVRAMYGLFRRYFAGADFDSFRVDLSHKDQVILIHCADALVGFSTVQTRLETFDGTELAVLFSGDTIIDRRHWGARVLERCWLAIAIEARERIGCPLYWLLISSGYRTYRFLPTFFQQFWPRYDRPTPRFQTALLDALCRRRFGAAYRDGVVHHDGARLRDGVSPIDPGRLRDPHVAYFVRANPGHLHGDELVCITEVDPGNLTRAGRRVLRRLGQ